MARSMSVEELMERFVTGRDLQIITKGRIIRGPISVICVRPEDNAILIRHRWLVMKGASEEKWKQLGQNKGFTKLEGPCLIDDLGMITGKAGDSTFTIYPLKECLKDVFQSV